MGSGWGLVKFPVPFCKGFKILSFLGSRNPDPIFTQVL